MDCVFLIGLIIHIAKYKINYNNSYVLAEDKEQLENIKKELDRHEITYTAEELDYAPHLWARGIAIEDGDNLDEKAKSIVAEGEVIYYAKKELKELDDTINRPTEDLYKKTNTEFYPSTQAIVDRKNELRQIIKANKKEV